VFIASFPNQYRLIQNKTRSWRAPEARGHPREYDLIPLCVQYVENIYAKRQARAAFERSILQSSDCKMVLLDRHAPSGAREEDRECSMGKHFSPTHFGKDPVFI
jgi:hypothetical protein